MIRSTKLRQSAEGESCTMRSPMCNGDNHTVSWCHSNLQEHGKGRGLKAHDIFGFYGCSGCHYWLDKGKAPREDKRQYFYRAHATSLLTLIEKGLVKIG